MLKRILFLVLLIVIAVVGTVSLLKAEPRRIVSLNPCLDTILVHIADHSQIAALSHYARDPSASTIADIARNLPFTTETAEEIITLNPDLILSAGHSSLATRKSLEKLGFKTELFPVPGTISESLAQIRRVAELVGQKERGEGLVRRIEEALDRMRPSPDEPHYTALVFQSGGLVPGRKTLIDDMMSTAGLRNMAEEYGVNFWGTVSLERLLDRPPQILLTDIDAGGKPVWADRVLSHPALARMEPAMTRANLPQQLIYCGGPVLLKTAEALTSARRKMERQP